MDVGSVVVVGEQMFELSSPFGSACEGRMGCKSNRLVVSGCRRCRYVGLLEFCVKAGAAEYEVNFARMLLEGLSGPWCSRWASGLVRAGKFQAHGGQGGRISLHAVPGRMRVQHFQCASPPGLAA